MGSFIKTLVKLRIGLADNDGGGDNLPSRVTAIKTSWDSITLAVNAFAAAQGAGIVVYKTKVDMLADTNQQPGTAAWVLIDPDPTANTSYGWDGISWQSAFDRLTFALGNGSGFQQSGSGSPLRTVQDKMRESITPYDKGAVGDGVADDTLAMAAAAKEAVTRGVALDLLGQTWGCANLDFPAQLKVIPNGAMLKYVGAPPASGQTTYVVRLAGNGITIDGILTVDGHKSAYSCPPDGNHFDFYSVGTSGHKLGTIICQNGIRNGFCFDGVSDFKIGHHIVTGCYLTGALFYGCSKFVVSQYDYNANGYGFGKSKANHADVSHDFAGWGCAISYQCSNFQFIIGIAHDNGRDGLGVGNGSNEGFVGGEAAWNGDGGYTLFADDNGTGRPGENMPPYRMSYNCKSYGNRSSGLAAYVGVDRLTVRGSYFNNNAIAGQRASATSANAGVFLASGCTSADLDVNAYDDRQTATATGLSSPTFTVSGWKTGTLSDYPYVAVRASDGTLKGYAKVVAESAATVTLISAPNTGVPLGSIAIGDTISAATQDYGVYVGPLSTGDIYQSGDSTAVSYSKVFFATTPGGPYGGKAFVKSAHDVSGNLIANGNFSSDAVGSQPANWSLSLFGGSASVANTGQRRGTNTLVITSSTSDAYAQVYTGVAGQMDASTLALAQGSQVRATALCYVVNPGDAKLRIMIETSVGVFSQYEAIAGKRDWQMMMVTAMVPATALSIRIRAVATGGSKTVRFNQLDAKVVG